MLKIKVYEMMARRGFKTRKQLSEAVGVHQSNIGRIVDGKLQRLNIGTLEGLCRALDCQPGDLMEYVPETEAR